MKQDKHCLILGSNSDVGQACAYLFAQEGYHLWLASRNLDDYQKQLASDLQIRHQVQAKLLFFQGEDFEHHEELVEGLEQAPAVVISVFGHLGSQERAQKDFAEAQQIINANFTGHVSLLNLLANQMEATNAGTIVGVSSVAGERGRQSNYIYGASKAGFTAYLSGLRNRLVPSGVHVATIIPGFISTKMLGGLKTPSLLTATPQQVAKAIYKAHIRKQNVVYTLSVWRMIMAVIKSIPEMIFKRLRL